MNRSLRIAVAMIVLAVAVRAYAAGPIGVEFKTIAAPAKVILIEFTQNGCPPCRKMQPKIAAMKKAGVDIRTASLNDPNTAGLFDRNNYNVKTTPTFVAVDTYGHELGRIVGETTEAKLRALGH